MHLACPLLDGLEFDLLVVLLPIIPQVTAGEKLCDEVDAVRLRIPPTHVALYDVAASDSQTAHQTVQMGTRHGLLNDILPALLRLLIAVLESNTMKLTSS